MPKWTPLFFREHLGNRTLSAISATGIPACFIRGPRASAFMGPVKSYNMRTEYMGKLEGKIALVTGGNSGIGLATAKQFVNEGAYVFITGRRGPELAAAVKEIGRNVTGVPGDVSNLGDLDRLFAQIKREKDKLDKIGRAHV